MMRNFEEILKEYNEVIRKDLTGFLERKYNFIEMLKRDGYKYRVAVDLNNISIGDLLMGMGLCSSLEVYTGGEVYRCIVMVNDNEESKYILYDLNKDKRIDIADAIFVYLEL